MACAKRAKAAGQHQLAYALSITAGAWTCSDVEGVDTRALLVDQLGVVDLVLTLMHRALESRQIAAKYAQDNPERN